MKLATLLFITLALACFSNLSFAQTGMPKPDVLKPYQWQSRLIIIFADLAEDNNYQEQLKTLESYPFELEDRQLEIISIFQNNGFVYSFTKASETEDILKTKTLKLEALTSADRHNAYASKRNVQIVLIF